MRTASWGNWDGAEDVTQGAFVLLWANRDRWREGSSAALLYRIARNAALDVLKSPRHAAGSDALEGLVAQGTPEGVIGEGRLHVFLDVFNLYNRRNLRSFDYKVDLPGGRVISNVGETLLPLLPSFGFTWEFWRIGRWPFGQSGAFDGKVYTGHHSYHGVLTEGSFDYGSASGRPAGRPLHRCAFSSSRALGRWRRCGCHRAGSSLARHDPRRSG